MALSISAGELKHPVVFKQPTSSLNDEGGDERTHTAQITTYAAVRNFNVYRTLEALTSALIGSYDFYIRHSEEREAITKDWLIEYRGEDYTIHQIERVEQKQKFIRFTAKVRTDA